MLLFGFVCVPTAALDYAPPVHKKRLKAVLDKIGDLLDDLEEKLEWIAS